MRLRLVLASTLVGALLCAVAAFWPSLSSAQEKTAPPEKPAEPEFGKDWRIVRDALDTVYAQLQKDNGLRSSETVDDETFLRRAFLDLLGVPPQPEDIDAFRPGKRDSKGRTGQKKREALIESLLARPECADNFAEYWRVQCIGRDKGGDLNNNLEDYFRQAFLENRGWDRIVRDLVSADGRTPQNPAVAYTVAYGNVRADLTGATARLFMGKQIQCAQCHDHPFEGWKTEDFEGLQGFFAMSGSGQRGNGPDQYLYAEDRPMPNSASELSSRLRGGGMGGKTRLPKYLGGEVYKFNKEKPLRLSMAEWMTSADNKWFREMTVNRYFGYFLGMGFVNPIDDFNSVNTPSSPIILEQMGKDFAASGFDLRYLITAICTSKLYQRGAEPTKYNRADRVYYSRFFVRKLSPEQLYRAIVRVSGVETLNTGAIRNVKESEYTPEEKQYKMWRDRVNGYKGNLARVFRDAYGSDEPEKAFDDYSGSVLQALVLMNFNVLGDGSLKTSLSEILKNNKEGARRIELIYQSVLGRNPTQREWNILRSNMGAWPNDDVQYEDLFLALMNTTEFVTIG